MFRNDIFPWIFQWIFLQMIGFSCIFLTTGLFFSFYLTHYTNECIQTLKNTCLGLETTLGTLKTPFKCFRAFIWTHLKWFDFFDKWFDFWSRLQTPQASSKKNGTKYIHIQPISPDMRLFCEFLGPVHKDLKNGTITKIWYILHFSERCASDFLRLDFFLLKNCIKTL